VREKEGERRKKEEREEIKIKIRPSQLQTAITFDRKLRLKRVTRSRKAYDEIYKDFQGQNILSSSQKRI
jgi:hypothetical protein